MKKNCNVCPRLCFPETLFEVEYLFVNALGIHDHLKKKGEYYEKYMNQLKTVKMINTD